MTDRYKRWSSMPVYLQLDAGVPGAPYRLLHDNGALEVFLDERRAVQVAGAAGTPISTLTPLTGWLDLSNYNHTMFTAANDGNANVTLTVEFSDDGIHADIAATSVIAVPGSQASVDNGVLTNGLHTFWRLSATVTGFGQQLLTWKVMAVPRHGV